jgi:hypothetical protein
VLVYESVSVSMCVCVCVCVLVWVWVYVWVWVCFWMRGVCVGGGVGRGVKLVKALLLRAVGCGSAVMGVGNFGKSSRWMTSLEHQEERLLIAIFS